MMTIANRPIKRFEDLIGCTITKITVNEWKDRILFTLLDGREFLMYHSQQYCEHVSIEDLCGNLDDLLHSPITLAEERTNGDDRVEDGIERWTFYKIGTVRGVVTIRWYGSSNGYYSVGVDFEESDYLDDDDDE